MPRLEYFIVCRSVSMDIDTDEITLSNVVEDAFLDEGAYIPKIIVVSSWEITQEELETDFQALLRIKLPDQAGGAEFPMNLARGKRRHRAMMGVLEIPLPGPGDLHLEVLLNGKHSATHVITIHPQGVRRTSGTDQHLNTPPVENAGSPS